MTYGIPKLLSVHCILCDELYLCDHITINDDPEFQLLYRVAVVYSIGRISSHLVSVHIIGDC